MQLQLSGTGNYHLELAITIMHRVNQGRTRKLMHRSGLNLPLPSKTGQEHRTPYRTTKTHINPATSMQQQLQLSGTGNNHLDLAKKNQVASKSKQSSKHRSTGQTRTYRCRLEQARRIQHLREPSKAI